MNLHNLLTAVRFSIAILSSQIANIADEIRPYPFAAEPIECLKKLEMVERIAGRSEYSVAPYEHEIVAALSKGSISDQQWFDAFLIASGEQRREQHAAHHALLEDFIDELEPKLISLPKREQGEMILREMHARLMSGGYVEEQSSLATLFESKKFNCVSSTVLYYIVCARLGLKLELLEFPGSLFTIGHVMPVFVDSERPIDVETTNVDGFDIRRKIAEGGGYSLSIMNINDAKKIDGRGLLRCVYGNRIAECDEAGRWFDSLKLKAMALAVNSESKSCQTSFIGGFTNWTISLNEAQRMRDSIEVLKVALDIAPEDYGLTKELEFTLAKTADTLIESDQDEKVSLLFRQGRSALPTMDAGRKQVEAYILAAQKRIKPSNYSDSIEVLNRGFSVGDIDVKKEIGRVRAEYYCAWSQELVAAKSYAAAATILDKALKNNPDDAVLLGGLTYMTQETLKSIDADVGPVQVGHWYKELQRQFPDLKQIVDTAKSHVYRLVDRQLAKNDYSAARRTLVERTSLLNDEAIADLACRIVDSEAQELMKAKNWLEAIQVYQQGLEKYPDNHLLLNNLAFSKQEAKGE